MRAAGVAFLLLASFALQACPSGLACQCGAGQVENSFASGEVDCCPAGYPYYCTGTRHCYQTWSDAYYGNSAGCVLPQDRQTCAGGDSSGGGSCTPDCAKGTHQVGCTCVPNGR
jgi:hypothetical protein